MENTYYYKHNPIVKNIFFTMLVPTILMNLTTALASFADTVIIGHFLDELSLSVVTFSTPIYMIINTVAALYAVGGSIAMSIDSGKGDKETAGEAFSVAVELMAVTGGLLLLAGICLNRQIPVWLGAGENVFDMVRAYSTIILVSAPFFMFNVGLAFFVRNDGRPTLSMVGMFLSIAVNIVFDIIFIGVFKLGVAGAAYATVLGQIVSLLVISSHFLSKKNTLRFRFVVSGMIVRIIRNGASTALHFVYQFLSILILNHYVMRLAGTDGVVVYTVVFNLYTVSLALFEGLSQTIQPMVSLYYGEQSHKKIKDTLRLVFLATIVICGTATVLLELFPGVVPAVFGIRDGMLLQQSVVAVRIYSTSMIIMTINVIAGYYLQSTEHNSMAATLVSLRCFILFLGSAFLLGGLFGMNGVWGSYTMAEVLSFVVFLVMDIIKRGLMKKEGIDADVFLLDSAVEKGTDCFTCDCEKEDFAKFCGQIVKQLREDSAIDVEVALDTEHYLEGLGKCAHQTAGKYVEVEVNHAERKVFIRDNLEHGGLETYIEDFDALKNRSEYGPVLGWNRICMECNQKENVR